ncbi:unnamed protein product [Clonostachys rosea]|uniref:Xylanolytic transcriptional activator regulatory domain-containing protein n=1 Tax=Bionectria ochroleuca TaxID=29856 RepID=A0ABY6UKH2_BIOOC|nr:unnamed protein product [Clonostachys rosea]
MKGNSSASLNRPLQDGDGLPDPPRSEHFREPAANFRDEDAQTGGPTRETESPLLIESQHDAGPSSSSGRCLSTHDPETRFLDTANWEALIRNAGTTQTIQQRPSFASGGTLRPSLLFEISRGHSYEELVNCLPAKPIVDQLVNLFVNGTDIPTLPIHLPVFLKDYQFFWNEPDRMTLPWLSVLFSIITLGLQYVLRSGSTIDGIPYPEPACRKFASKAAECLRTFDYAKPGPRTVEAMIMYMLCEHMWLGEHRFRASLILSLTIRLAMRAGYHRDPSHYSQISIFEGEVRRRSWSYLVQLDILFASYLGLPRHISDQRTDTALPSNIADEDLQPNITSLPPPRNPDEPSAISFLNYREQLCKILGQITECTISFEELPYDEVLGLDQALDRQIKARPVWLHQSPCFELRLIEDTLTTNQAIEVDILEQRARIILHRRFLVPAHTNPQYLPSRDKCIAAAALILQHQVTVSQMSFHVDGMSVPNWRALSLMQEDFLLAAIILCLHIDQEVRHGRISRDLKEFPTKAAELQEHIGLLRSCRKILLDVDAPNRDAQRAAQVIELVLLKADGARNGSLEHDDTRSVTKLADSNSSGFSSADLVPLGPEEASFGDPYWFSNEVPMFSDLDQAFASFTSDEQFPFLAGSDLSDILS